MSTQRLDASLSHDERDPRAPRLKVTFAFRVAVFVEEGRCNNVSYVDVNSIKKDEK